MELKKCYESATFGMSEKLGNIDYMNEQQSYLGPTGPGVQAGPETQEKIDAEVRKIVDEGYDTAKQILTKNKKKLDENIQAYQEEAEFSIDEKIANLSDLTGIFPLDLVINDTLHQRFRDRAIPPLGDEENRFSYRVNDGYISWCIPREIIKKKTRNKKDFWIVRVTDETCVDSKIKCWGVNSDKDNLYLNRPYIVKVNFSDQWGFSTKRGTSNCLCSTRCYYSKK